MDGETFALLRERRAALVWISSLRMPMRCELTADFAYVRLHGLEGGPMHDYSEEELQPWASEISRAAKGVADVFVYFNNDKSVRAIGNARALQKMVGGQAARVSEDQ
jgi:uncharacterized protein YecE (DUF72 family)